MDPIIGVIIAAILSSGGAYLLAAKKMSGKIGTSDAEQLWAESKAIREWSREHIASLDKEILDLRSALRDVLARVTGVEVQNTNLSTENQRLTQEIRVLSDTVTELRAEVVTLKEKLTDAYARIVELKEEIGRKNTIIKEASTDE